MNCSLVNMLIILLHVSLFWTSLIILNFIISHGGVKFGISSKSYTVYVTLLVWLLIALPLTSVFLVKVNLLLVNLFESWYIICLFGLLNTLILLLYYKYYSTFMQRKYSKQAVNVSSSSLYNRIWVYSIFLLAMYFYSYLVVIFL